MQTCHFHRASALKIPFVSRGPRRFRSQETQPVTQHICNLSRLSIERILMYNRIVINRFIHSFISGMHHYECVVPNVDVNLQSGWFWAKSIASFRERLNDSRSCWIVFIHVVRGRPGGLLQFSRWKLLRSSHLFRPADAQCGRTGRDAVLGQWLRGVVAQLSILHHHSTHGGTIFGIHCT